MDTDKCLVCEQELSDNRLALQPAVFDQFVLPVTHVELCSLSCVAIAIGRLGPGYGQSRVWSVRTESP